VAFFHDDLIDNGLVFFMEDLSDDCYFLVDDVLKMFKFVVNKLLFLHSIFQCIKNR